MAELKVDRRQWEFVVEFADGETPDVRKRYSTGTTYRPHDFTFTVRAWGSEAPELATGIIHGRYVKNDGSLGSGVNETVYGINNLRECFPWLEAYVSLAIERALKELNLGVFA
ncbi:hypothetical protein EAS64_33675 [Trebonia kvetii]|uniref:Uncharacterized protein n=1 Tax=Trebonia kvetii TaxID=2480626 RepID=A0A6P2BS25_9ACTN|nr:hypothetical protein [Trebonia kvetii]TVZ01231.1 hypothetical protein EAS64_33675 [Trebonia kvetii]